MNTTAGTGDDPAALRLALQQSRAALAAEHANYRALLDEVQRDKLLFKRVQELALIGGWQWNRASDALYLTSEAIHILGASTPPTTMADMLCCLQANDRLRLQKTLNKHQIGTSAAIASGRRRCRYGRAIRVRSR